MTQATQAKLENQLAELRKELAKVRKQQANNKVMTSYEFSTDSENVTLLDLFGDKDDLLLIHSMGAGCSYCTVYADGINGVLDQISTRTSVALVSNDTAKRQNEFAKEREWKFKMVSALGTTFSRDMGYEPTEKEFWPGIMGFNKVGNDIILVSQAEFDPGDNFCVAWPLFSLLKSGTDGWEPHN